jgi:hypothetical protein
MKTLNTYTRNFSSPEVKSGSTARNVPSCLWNPKSVIIQVRGRHWTLSCASLRPQVLLLQVRFWQQTCIYAQFIEGMVSSQDLCRYVIPNDAYNRYHLTYAPLFISHPKHIVKKHCATSWKVARWIPDVVTGLLSWPNIFSCTMALGSTQILTEMATRNLLVDKERPALKADNLIAICESIF